MTKNLLRLGVALFLSFTYTTPTFADSSDSTAVVPSTAPAKSSNHFFRAIGNYVSKETLGVSLPGGDEPAHAEPVARAPDSVESQASASDDEMTRSQVDQQMHQVGTMTGQGAIMKNNDAWLLDRARHARLPKNAAEAEQLDQVARNKGYTACMYWMYPLTPENLAKITDEKDRKMVMDSYKKEQANEAKGIRTPPDMGPETSMWVCRHDVQETKYQLAKATGDPAKIQKADADYAAFGKEMEAAEKKLPKGE